MKSKRGKAPSKDSFKKTLPVLHKLSLADLVSLLQATPEKNHKKTMEEFLQNESRTVMEAFLKFILNVVGVEYAENLVESYLSHDNKEKVVKMIVRHDLQNVSDDRQNRYSDVVSFFMLYKGYYESNLQTNKKNSLRKRWFEFLEQMMDWLYVLSDVAFEKFRKEVFIITMKVLKIVTNILGLAYDPAVMGIVEPFLAKYVVHRLNDVSDFIKIETLNFMNYLMEDRNLIIHPHSSENDYFNITSSLLRRLNDDDARIRNLSAVVLYKLLADNIPSIASKVVETFLNYKDYAIKAALLSSPKDIDLIFALAKRLKRLGGLSSDDLNKYFLLMFHHNKAVSQKAVAFYLDQRGLSGEFAERFDENTFVGLISSMGQLIEIQSQKDKKAEFSHLVQLLAEEFDFLKFKDDILELLNQLSEKKNLGLKSKTLLRHILEFLLGLLKFADQTNQSFFEYELDNSFFALSHACMKDEENLQMPLLRLYFQKNKDVKAQDFELQARRINQILRITESPKIIKLIFWFFQQHRHQSRVIEDLLVQNYEAYKIQLACIKLDQEFTEDSVILLYKINALSKVFFTEKDIASDFYAMNQVLEAYGRGALTFEGCLVIKVCLNFKLLTYKAVFYRFFRFPQNLEVAKSNNDQARSHMIALYEKYMEYQPSNFNLHNYEKHEIRLEAFCLLIDLYELVCCDAVWKLNFICYIPSESNINALAGFIANAFENYDKKASNYLTSDQNMRIRNSRSQSILQNSSFLMEENSQIGDSHIKSPSNERASLADSEQYGILWLIASRTIDLLAKCNNTFGRRSGHELISLMYKYSSLDLRLDSMIYVFLKKVLLDDFEKDGGIVFWNYLYRTALFSNLPREKLTDLIKLILKIYYQISTGKQQADQHKSLFQRNFFACLSKLFSDAYTDKKHWTALDVITFAFINKKNFKGQEEKLKAFLWKVYTIKQGLQQTNENKELYDKIDALEKSILKVIGYQRKQEGTNNEAAGNEQFGGEHDQNVDSQSPKRPKEGNIKDESPKENKNDPNQRVNKNKQGREARVKSKVRKQPKKTAEEPSYKPKRFKVKK